MKTLFINCSKDKNGLTAQIAAGTGKDFETLNLVDYMVYPLGQEKNDDQFMKVCKKIAEADDLIIGTPVYWSSMSAYVKILIDRMTDVLHDNNPFQGKNMVLIIDGFEPLDAIPHIEHVWKHVADRFGMTITETITNKG
ncbi:flavodoxin family protein [Fructilactobacillus sp. Tb1]|uniref:flavodoxin family protein n=1 Tax=Fructilactobacillus sp. Tb1 TaxID=3422304 RepID=UPI003D28257B